MIYGRCDIFCSDYLISSIVHIESDIGISHFLFYYSNEKYAECQKICLLYSP